MSYAWPDYFRTQRQGAIPTPPNVHPGVKGIRFIYVSIKLSCIIDIEKNEALTPVFIYLRGIYILNTFKYKHF